MESKIAVLDNRPLFLVLLIAITAMILSGSVLSMPPHPDLEKRIQNGQASLPANKVVISYQPEQFGYDQPAQRSGKITGTFNALCILVDFSDNNSSTVSFDFDTLIYANQPGSVHDYYSEISYTQLDLITINLPSDLGWKRAPQTYAYYVDNNYGTDSPYPNNSRKLCEDLVDLVDAAVDFSQYDNDGNGYVDVVMISHAGPGAEYTGNPNDIWSHKWSITPRMLDGVYIYNYAIMPEYWNTPGDMTIGVYCHELGHGFGLPDLYDIDNSSYGIGRWSLMASGSWNGSRGSSPAHMDAWCKTEVGWVSPTNISSNATNVAISNVETNQTVFRLWTSGSIGSEYFLIENRQQIGYDAALPGSGLLIWHIDESVGNNMNEWYPGHEAFGNFTVALEQADNLFQLEQNISNGNSGDPFPGSTNNNSFGPVTSPNSDSYASSNSFVSISNISASAATMYANFAVSLAANYEGDEPNIMPIFSLSQNYPNPFNPTTLIAFTLPSAGEVEINIFNVLGEKVDGLHPGYLQPGDHFVWWDGTDFNGRGLSSGVYLYELISDDNQEVRQMVLLK